MQDVDEMIAALARRAEDPRLERLDAAALVRMAQDRAPLLSGAGLGAVMAVAMVVGMAGSAWHGRAPVGPGAIGGVVALAPSALLVGAQ